MTVLTTAPPRGQVIEAADGRTFRYRHLADARFSPAAADDAPGLVSSTLRRLHRSVLEQGWELLPEVDVTINEDQWAPPGSRLSHRLVLSGYARASYLPPPASPTLAEQRAWAQDSALALIADDALPSGPSGRMRRDVVRAVAAGGLTFDEAEQGWADANGY